MPPTKRFWWQTARMIAGICVAIAIAKLPVVHAADVPLCTATGDQRYPAVASDGFGGVLAAWTDTRMGYDLVFARRLGANGQLVGSWSTSGLQIGGTRYIQDHPRVANDGFGGMFVAWTREDGASPPLRTCVQHVLPGGAIDPAWPDTGIIAISHRMEWALPGFLDPVDDFPMQMVADGSGGVIVVARGENESQTGFVLWAQRLTANGTPAPGWPAGGIELESGTYPQIVGDGSGGVIVAFFNGLEMRAQHIPGTGVAPDWSALLRTMIVSEIGGTVDGPITAITTDGAGGAYVAMTDATEPNGIRIHFLVRVGASGVPANGWPAGGRRIVPQTEFEVWLSLAPDAAGGVYAAWMEEDNSSNTRLLLKRFNSDATNGNAWPDSGLMVGPNRSHPYLVTSNDGGVFVTFSFLSEPFIVRFTNTGIPAPGWTKFGKQIASASGSHSTRGLARGAGNTVIAVWNDRRLTGQEILYDLYSTWITVNGPVAVTASLVSADAASDRVRLTWQVSSATSIGLERRTDGEWIDLGSLAADGFGRVAYEDQQVRAGTRYTYRLRFMTEDGPQYAGHVEIETPSTTGFSFSGAHPNPVAPTSVFEFDLDGTDEASIEIIDVTGRRVARQTIAGGPGRHLVPLASVGRLAPGVYQVRLRQSGRMIARRIVAN